jgi:Beta-galactosidase
MKFTFATASLRTLSALAIMLASTFSYAQTATPLPLNNPGFEGTYLSTTGCANITGEVASGWGDNTCWDEKKPLIRYAQDSVNPHGGAAAQKITLLSGSRVQFSYYYTSPFTAGSRYTASVWMRSAAPMFVTLSLRQAGPPYAGYSSKLIKLSSNWAQYEVAGLSSSDNAVLLINADTPGTFWVDDASATSEVISATAAPTPPNTPIPRELFGMHFNNRNTPWPNINGAISSVRIWDAGANIDRSGVGPQWSEVNSAPGVYDWSSLDALVNTALSRNADVVYTLGGRTPQWAAANPNGPSPYGPGQCAEPKNDQVWQDWLRAITTRYKGKIRLWEVWNEPDIVDFYCGSPDKLIDLARQAYTIIKEVDPANRVLSPGFSGFQGPGYLDYFLAQGGGQYADILSYHFYVYTPEENANWRMINIQDTIRRNNAQAKPLWNTEQGWIDIPNPKPIPQATGAAYVARAYLLHWAYGIERFYYYAWDNDWNQFQFVQTDGLSLTQAGVAYREVAQWMTGKVMESISVDNTGTYTVTLRDSRGRKQRVVWNPNQSVQLVIPAAWNVVQQKDLAGTPTDLRGKTVIAVGESPLLLQGRSNRLRLLPSARLAE